MPIAGDDDLRARCNGAFEDVIVVRISRHGAQSLAWLDELGAGSDVALVCAKLLVRAFELVLENAQRLANDGV